MYWWSVRHPRVSRRHPVLAPNVQAPAVPGVASRAGICCGVQPLQPVVLTAGGGFLDDQQDSAVGPKRHHFRGDESARRGVPLQQPRGPRSSKGTPSRSNSSLRLPTPRMSRPLLTLSKVPYRLAISSG